VKLGTVRGGVKLFVNKGRNICRGEEVVRDKKKGNLKNRGVVESTRKCFT